MNEEERLLKDAEELVAEFKSLAIVKEFRCLSEAISGDEKLIALKRESKQLRKNLGTIEGEKAQAIVIEKIRHLEAEYDSDPKVVNYRNLKEEIRNITDRITSILK